MKKLVLLLFIIANSLYGELITDLEVKWVVDGDTVHATKKR